MPAFPALIDLSNLGSDGFALEGDSAYDQIGLSVSAAGDVNGDGFDDFIVGARLNDGSGVEPGAAYLIFGRASGLADVDLANLAAADGFRIRGEAVSDYAGLSVSSAGDVNGDGLDDLFIGAFGNDSGGSDAGAAYVLFGKASGLANVDLATLAAVDGFKIQGDADNDRAGAKISSAGDLNGDGFDEIFVAAPYNDSGGAEAGAGYVIWGKASGFGTIDLAGLTTAQGFKIQGDSAGDQAGRSVSAAGDFNGDGFDDLIIGTPYSDRAGTNAGAAYVVLGRANGYTGIDLTAAGMRIIGDLAGHVAGISVSSAGDFNQDGFDDLIVGARGVGGGAGAAYIVFGRAAGFSTLDLTFLTAADGFKIEGAPGDVLGNVVSGAGDINGDGYGDIILGVPTNGSGGANAGGAYVIFGKASGFTTLNVASMAAADGFRIQGDAAMDLAGRSVSAAGDVDGDGFDDILVGAHLNDAGGTDAGAAYVIFGRGEPNQAPAGADSTKVIQKDHAYILEVADFGFSDGDGEDLGAVRIAALPGAGMLLHDPDGPGAAAAAAVTVGQLISLYDIEAGRLSFVPAPGAEGGGYASVAFQVRDDGGTLNGGVDLDPTPNSLTFDVLPGADPAIAFPTALYLSAIGQYGYFIQGDAGFDDAGLDVSDAGDVNGDGFGDIIVSAWRNDAAGSDAGAAYVIFGKASGLAAIDLSTLAPGDGFMIRGEAAGDLAGDGVSSAGDFNGDGLGDIIVGASGNDSGGTIYGAAGAAYIVFGKASGFGTVDLAGLGAADGFRILGENNADNAGRGVSSAGDVNGDGYDDVILDAVRHDGGGTDAGAAYVVFGKPSGFGQLDLATLGAADGFKILGDAASDYVGNVSSAGDANGDGFDDIIVGANGNDSGGNRAGAAYLIFGKAGGFATIDLGSLGAAAGFKIQGDAANDYTGLSVSSAGDINGDGFDEIVVGADRNDAGGSNAGAAFVIFGKASGFSPIDLSSLSAPDGFRIQGADGNANAGLAVSSAGDVNGDGLDDILVGAPGAGAAYLVFGREGGFATLDLSSFAHSEDFLPAADGFRILSSTYGEGLARAVSSAGDVNGDGFDDILVGAPSHDGGGNDAGGAYLIFGRGDPNLAPSGTDAVRTIPDGQSYIFAAADFGFSDGDGEDLEAVRITTLPGAGTLMRDADGAGPGGAAAVSAGQTISLADIEAGKLSFVPALGPGAGNHASFTFQVQDDGGTANGGVDLDPSPNIFTLDWDNATGFPSLIDLGALGGQGFAILGDADNDRAGWSVSTAGDVNGDGYDDIIIGAVDNDAGSHNAGAAYVLFGKPGGFATIDLATLVPADGFKILGDSGNDFAGVSVSSAGDVNGDGFDDIVLGSDNDAGGYNAGAAYVIFGKASGFATVDLTGLALADGFRIQGDAAGDHAGSSVSSAGDINNDGYDDLLVGADFQSGGGGNAGAVYLLYGKASGFAPIDLTGLAAADGFRIQGGAVDFLGCSVSEAGDVNGDGIDDFLIGARTDSSGGNLAGSAYLIFGKAGGIGAIDLDNLAAGDGFRVQGDANYDGAGTSVSSAGDVNGDGFDDIVIGAPRNDSGGYTAGAAYVIFGKASGFATIDLTGLTPADGFKIQGADPNDLAGLSVSSAGDMDGDGFDDLLVGAIYNGAGGYKAGAAYVIFGKASGFAEIDLGGLAAADGFRIQGDAARDYAGRSVSAAGDVNGDGFGDVLVGATGNDVGGSGAGAAYVIFGIAPTVGVTRTGAAGDQTIRGGAGDDILDGLGGDDSLFGAGGSDRLIGGTGADSMDGGAGNDVYVVDDAGDSIIELAGNGTDSVESSITYALGDFLENLILTGSGGIGGTGNDLANVITGNGGDNIVDGAGGNDTFRMQDGGTDNASGGAGNDFFLFGTSLDSSDAVDGGAGTDQIAIQGNYTLTLGNGLVNIESLIPLPGNDVRFGDSGTNFYDYVLTAVDANLTAGQRLAVDANRLRVGEDFTFNGSAESDGNFFLIGGNGVDNLTGGAQSDTFLFGENGQFGASDIVNGGPGGTNDQLGLRGNYTIIFGAGQLIGLESIALVSSQDTRFGPLGSVFNYNLTMNDGNVIAGQLFTVDAAPLRAGETLTFNGAAETNGSYRVAGGAGNDSMIGGEQGDILIGRGGADAMTGGAGNDQFRYNEAADSSALVRDTILDFTTGDVIDLSRIDAIAGTPANDAFTFIGSTAFGNVAGQLRAYQSGADWLVEGDTNGDGAADLVIQLTAPAPLAAGDFIL